MFKFLAGGSRLRGRQRRPRGRGGPAAAAATKTVFEARTKLASLNFTNVPTWSDADIAKYFASTRDKRYFTDNIFPAENPRRITWLLPLDGCFARAEGPHGRITLAPTVEQLTARVADRGAC